MENIYLVYFPYDLNIERGLSYEYKTVTIFHNGC